jgi:hypothetical protein
MSTVQSSAGGKTSSRARAAVRRRSWGFILLLVLIVAILSYVAGLYTLYRDLAHTRLLLQGLQTETQKARRELRARSTAEGNLAAQLQRIQAELEAIRPAKDSYSLSPNQSVLVSDGLLSIGLVGPPMNGGLSLNVNGVRHAVASGDVIEVNVSNKTCRIAVQSFDMFRAVIVASCSTPT